jgi:hypothetical protein
MLSLDAEDRAHKWEAEALGSTTQDRVVGVARESTAWRERAGYERDFASVKNVHTQSKKYHKMGKHVMQMMVVDEYKDGTSSIIDGVVEEGREARARLRKKKVTVSEQEDGNQGLSRKIDKEWNTSVWDDAMVVDGVKTMFELFYNPANMADADSKDLACEMLVKVRAYISILLSSYSISSGALESLDPLLSFTTISVA